MATQAGEIEVKLTLNAKDFSKIINQGKQDVKSFGDNAKSVMGEIGKIFTFAEIAKFFKDSITAFGEQEQASAKLVRALELQGHATTETVKHLDDMAASLSKVSAVGDETITVAQATMVSFGLQGQALDRATKAALDMSAAMGIDLNQAAQLVGKAFVGETGQLGRYGIKISEALEPTEKFTAVLGQLEQRFGGQAQAQAQTFTGQLKGLGVAFNELQEAVGKLITGESGGLLKWITAIVTKVTESLAIIGNARAQFVSLGEFLKTFAVSILGTILLTITTLIQKIFEMESHIPVLGKLYGVLSNAMKTTNGWIEDQIVKIQTARLVSAQTTGAMVADEGKKEVAYQNTAKTSMDVSKAMNDWIMKQNLLGRDDFLAKNKEKEDGVLDFARVFVTTTNDVWNFAARTTESFFDGVGHGFADMVMEGKSFGAAMKALFKDIATEIIAWIIKMIIKMLIFLALREAASHFGPVGQAISSAMGVVSSAGALTHAAVGATIAEPSIVTGLRSGRQFMAGEAGPESIAPLNAGGSGGDGGGSGGITVNISGQFIEGDPASWQKLINEKIVPAIRRFTMATPTGPFNRRRGVA